ncbi:MAG: response regulator [Bdellovibrionota bacterium]
MKILLAEDDPSIHAIATMALSRVGGHQIVAARDGTEVLKLIEAEKPDLILLDVMMPKLDGFETCSQLKSKPETRDIPVIFLTAKAQLTEIQNGMNLGAIGYILKPFDPMTLHKQIEEVIANHAKAA